MSLRRSNLLPACLLMSALVTHQPDAHAGKLFSVATQRKMSRMPVLKYFVPKSKAQVFKVGDRQMTLEVPDQPIWAAFGKNDLAGDASVRSVKLGRAVAKNGFMLAWGGGKGLPKETANGAFLEGASTLAFSPSGDAEKHSKLHDGDTFQTTHLVLTGTGGGSGTIAREAPMAQSANHGVGSFSNGGPGTFGELIAMLHNDSATLAFMKGTGGVADAGPSWMTWLGAKPGFNVVSEADPKLLVKKALEAQRQAKRPQGAPHDITLVSPGSPNQIFAAGENKGHVVGAFMTHDDRMSKEDAAQVHELVQSWAQLQTTIAPKGAKVVLPESGASSASLAEHATSAGAETVVISPRNGQQTPGKMSSARTGPKQRAVYLGFGDVEMGKFVAAREVTQDADVVFFTSAHYQNLSALAYSLRDDRKPVIAILASTSTHADKLMEMVKVIDPKAAEKRVVVGTSAADLMKKVKSAVEKRHEKLLAEAAEGKQKTSLD